MAEKKKVIIIGSAWPLRGGLSAYNERLALQFQKRGYDVLLYTFSLQYPGFLFPGKTQYSTDPAPKELTIRIRINSINPLNWFIVGREIKKLNAELVIIKFWIPFMAPCLGTIARVIRRNKVSKVITIIDNIIPHEKRPGDRLLASYWANSVDGFMTMSRAVLDDVATFDNKKPRQYCPHPLYDNFGDSIPKNQAKALLNLDNKKRYVLFFGFIRDYKGLDILLKAFSDKRIRKLNIHLLVAGEFYTDSKPYFGLIESLNINDRVVMSNDFIPDKEVANYFSACDVVVQPYKNATQSGVTQIAYHFCKPIITTDVGGLAEMVPDKIVGYVVNPEVKEIADSIYQFYFQEKEKEFTKNVKKEKSKYSWDNVIKTVSLLAETKESQ